MKYPSAFCQRIPALLLSIFQVGLFPLGAARAVLRAAVPDGVAVSDWSGIRAGLKVLGTFLGLLWFHLLGHCGKSSLPFRRRVGGLRIASLSLGLTVASQGADVFLHFSSATAVPITAASYSAAGNQAVLSIGFAPTAGTILTVVKNTGLPFITGEFSNLPQGSRITLFHGGAGYPFIANYYGGSGNDLVLQWEPSRLVGWGNDREGELGLGDSPHLLVPTPVPAAGALAGKSILSIAISSLHSVALCADGTLAAWGDVGHGFGPLLGHGSAAGSLIPVAVDQTGVLAGRRVVAISCGQIHTLALCSDGRVAAWGHNESGQLGNGTRTDSLVPVLVSASGPLAGRTVVAISAGMRHSLALCADGTMVTWGANFVGQLGNGTTVDASLPVAVSMSGVLAGPGRNVVAVSTAGYHNLALCADGNVAAWGDNRWGSLGNGTLDPGLVPGLVTRSTVLAAVPGRNVVALRAAIARSLLLCQDGSLVSFGHGESGDLGNGGMSTSAWPVLVDRSGVLASRTVTALGMSRVSCSDRSIVTWGANSNLEGTGALGALGNGTTTDSPTPVLVSSSPLSVGESYMADLIWGGGYISHFALVGTPARAPGVITQPATSISSHTATLTGKVYAGYSTTAVRFEYGVDPSGGLSIVSPTTPATVSGNDAGFASFPLIGLAAGQTYRFRAIGENGAGTTNGAWLTFTTAPAAPTLTTLAATSITSTGAVLNGSVLANGAAAAVYFRYFSPGVAGMDAVAAPALVTGIAGTSVSASVTGLLPGTQYTFAVRASNSVGEGAWTNLTFTTLPDPAVGGLAEALNVPVAGGGLLGSVIQPDGRTIIFGNFTSVYGTPQGRMARLLADGTLEGGLGFNPGANGPISCAALLADGKIMIGGDFTELRPRGTGPVLPYQRLARLLPDGTVDTTFANPGVKAFVLCMAVQPDGAVLVGGDFNGTGSFMGTERNRIARITPAGTVDPAFNPNASASVYCIAVQPDGNVLLGGSFGNLSAQSHPFFGRVNGANGSPEPGFAGGESPNNAVFSMALQRDGRVVIGGQFDIVASSPRNHLARMNADGTLDSTFNPDVTGGNVFSLALQANQKLLIGGTFTAVGGTARSKVARVDTTGVLDGFNPNVTGGDVLSIALQADGKAQLAGTFTAINGGAAARSSYALLSNETAYQALEKRSATEVYWSRGGSAPEVLSVAFDQAAFLGSTFTPIGNGTRVDPLAGDWRLGGISPGLPLSGQIRARARTSSGYLSGSTGIMESKVSYIHSLPVVTTVSVGEITGTTAVLTGTVDTSTLTAVPAFKLDTTTAYTQPLRIATPASVTGTATFSYQVTGLTPGTAYVFRATAENAGGRVDGADIHFSTLGNLNALYNTGAEVPAAGSSYTATGRNVTFTLNYAPAPGTTLMVVNNTGNQPINGTFANLAQGQAVDLTSGFITYPFVAHYHGGTGNDLVLLWRNTRVLTWGWNNLGQLGNGNNIDRGLPVETVPFNVLDGRTVVGLSGGSQHSVALCVDGTIASWGDNLEGQLGNGDSAARPSRAPIAVDQGFLPPGIHPVAISAGGSHTLSLFSDGRVYAWGDNQYGQVGSRDAPSDHSLPTYAKGALNGRRVIGISAGEHHSLAVCDDGFAAAWGRGEYGQLGNGGTVNQDEPVAVDLSDIPAGEKLVAVAAGRWHSMALTSGGKVFTWGRNTEGQLGNGTTVSESFPILVTGLTASAIHGGGTMHSLARRSDGKLVAWGSNTYGQLGTGGFSNSYTPVQVSDAWQSGQSLAAAISGDEHLLAMRGDGTLFAWGLGNEGRLADNNTGIHTQPVPTPVNPIRLDPGDRWQAFASGAASQHSLAIVALSLQPTAITQPANVYSDTAAILIGAVGPHGIPTTPSFDYGTSTDYGTELGAGPEVDGLRTYLVSNHATGLIPGQTYHFRVKARRSGFLTFSSDGEDMTFTTLTRLQNWRRIRFDTIENTGAAADGADLDKDGIPNLLEFAFGLESWQNNSGQLPAPQFFPGGIQYNFTEPDTYMGLIYGAEWSTTLAPGSWTALPDLGVGAQHKFLLNTSAPGRVFMRLKVVNTGP